MARLRVGDQAPEFELEGTGSRSYRLGDYRGTGVLLAFYPGDFTPVCTKQFCSYRDDGDRIESLGLPMVGISPQSVESHKRFAGSHGLTVPLLSDQGKKVARSYGVVGPGGFIRRAIFLVDGDGVVRYRHVALFGLRYQEVGDLERAVAGLQSGGSSASPAGPPPK
jgi:peroxiredoxin Q/BCP